MNVGSELLVIVGLVLLNGFFSGAEIALLSVRKTRLAELSRAGGASARAAQQLRSNPERLLATVQVGITVISATAAALGGSALGEPLVSWLGEVGLATYAEALALALVVGGVSALSIVLGELVPKSLALRSSERFSLMVALPLTLVAVVARPVVWLLTAASNLVLWPFRDHTTFTETRLSAEELQHLVEEASSTGGSMHPGAGDIASRAIDLAGLRVSSILVPRSEMVTLSLDASTQEVRDLLKAEPHARYPVVGETGDDVKGYVLARELYEQLSEGKSVDLEAAIRPVRFMVESRRAVDALRDMQENRAPMAVVVDEHGNVAGLVAVADITQQLVGAVLSEHEVEEPRVLRESEHVFLAPGTTPIHELNRELDIDLQEGPGFTTVAGLVTHSAGRLVETGERVILPHDIVAEVVDANQRQVRVVRLFLPNDAPNSG